MIRKYVEPFSLEKKNVREKETKSGKEKLREKERKNGSRKTKQKD